MDKQAAEVPTSYARNLVACVPCHLVKTFEQFAEAGCENCAFLKLQEDRELVERCTTVEFSGVASVLRPGASWTAKWLRRDGLVPGVYAISVKAPADGLPQEVEEKLEEHGIDWRSGVEQR